MSGWFVEFPNDDVGPFATRTEAELYRIYEGNLDETQVFEGASSPHGRPFLVLSEFCPAALDFEGYATQREP